MLSVTDQTESLVVGTKKALGERGNLGLREIADGSGVGYEWLRKFVYGGISKPDISRVERVHTFMREWQAAKRYAARQKPERRDGVS